MCELKLEYSLLDSHGYKIYRESKPFAIVMSWFWLQGQHVTLCVLLEQNVMNLLFFFWTGCKITVTGVTFLKLLNIEMGLMMHLLELRVQQPILTQSLSVDSQIQINLTQVNMAASIEH